MIFIRTVGLHGSTIELMRWRRIARSSIRRAVKQEAHLARTMMTKGITRQAPGGRAFTPISVMTRKMRSLPSVGSKSQKLKRGSSKALIVSGDLRNSVNVQESKSDSLAFSVGVHRGTRGKKSGKDMVNIAAIHEYGAGPYGVKVTRKMHRFSIFLFLRGVLKAPWPIGKVLTIKIPARPFVAPTEEEWSKGADDRFQQRLRLIMLGGTSGRL